MNCKVNVVLRAEILLRLSNSPVPLHRRLHTTLSVKSILFFRQVFCVVHDLLSIPKCVTRNKQNNYQLPVLLKMHVGIRDLIFSYYNFVDACTKAFCCLNGCFIIFSGNSIDKGKYFPIR